MFVIVAGKWQNEGISQREISMLESTTDTLLNKELGDSVFQRPPVFGWTDP